MALDVWSHWMNVPIQVSLIVSIESFKRISILNCVHYTRLKITNLKGMISEGSPGTMYCYGWINQHKRKRGWERPNL